MPDDDQGTGAIDDGDSQTVKLTGAEYERYLFGALNEPRDPVTRCGDLLDDVLLSFQRIAPPPAPGSSNWSPTIRQRYRIWKDQQKRRILTPIHQAIHDRLTYAYCDY